MKKIILFLTLFLPNLHLRDLREKTIGLLNWARQEQDKLYKDMLYLMQLDLERASRLN